MARAVPVGQGGRWDAAAVRAALAAAGETLRAVDGGPVFPAGYRSTMPTPVRSVWERLAMEPDRLRPARPNPQDVAILDQAMDWIAGVSHQTWRRALWGVVLGASLRDWAPRLGVRSPETVRHWQRAGLGEIVRMLNA